MLNNSKYPILSSPVGLVFGALILTVLIYKKYTQEGQLNEHFLNFIIILLVMVILIPLSLKYRYYLGDLSRSKFYKAAFLHLIASVIFGLVVAGVVLVLMHYYPNLFK